MKQTEQIKFWRGNFGEEYTKRNALTVEGLDDLHIREFGLTRKSINDSFLGKLSRDIRILEVGCNVGQQLRHLELMGFTHLYGIDIQEQAVKKANALSKHISAKVGSILEIPFGDNEFDLVFTSGVLIHISPEDLDVAIKEIYRCSSRYIFGFEYFANDFQSLVYRGHSGFLWKGDYCQIFQQKFPDLKILKEEKLKYIDSDNVNQLYLMEKNHASTR